MRHARHPLDRRILLELETDAGGSKRIQLTLHTASALPSCHDLESGLNAIGRKSGAESVKLSEQVPGYLTRLFLRLMNTD